MIYKLSKMMLYGLVIMSDEGIFFFYIKDAFPRTMMKITVIISNVYKENQENVRNRARNTCEADCIVFHIERYQNCTDKNSLYHKSA